MTKPQAIVEEMAGEGYDVVIFGDAEHPEVKGVKSYAGERAFVVSSPEEALNIRLNPKVALVSQTTRKVENFLKVAGALIARCKEVRVFNTICNATFDNQEAAANLAREVEVMLVVGGKNSSNTKQLLTIAQKYCPESHLVEDETDLEPGWFAGKTLCGVTAGASTPGWIIERVVAAVREL